MKKTLFSTIQEIAKADKNFVFVKADTAYLPEFQTKFPFQYVDVGIAEQNMIGIASGLALTGKVVFTYSIVNFATMRCLEQIRNDLAYHNLNVKVISCGQGLDYGNLGVTHHATEDIAIMRAIPNITILCPCDSHEASACFRFAYQNDGVFFIRNGHGNEPCLHKREILSSEITKPLPLLEGKRIIFFVTGSIASEVLNAGLRFRQEGHDVGVYSFPCIKPIDTNFIISAARTADYIFTVEEHSIIGGLGSAVSEILSECFDFACKFKRIGLNDVFSCEIGTREYLLDFYQMNAKSIYQYLKNTL